MLFLQFVGLEQQAPQGWKAEKMYFLFCQLHCYNLNGHSPFIFWCLLWLWANQTCLFSLQYSVSEPRKRAYAEFYKNYDTDKEFNAMREAGIFESAQPTGKWSHCECSSGSGSSIKLENNKIKWTCKFEWLHAAIWKQKKTLLVAFNVNAA